MDFRFPRLIFWLAFLLCPFARGESVRVSAGGVNIDIPVPPGYYSLSSSDPAFVQIKAEFGSHGNELMAVLIPEEFKHINPEEFSLAMNFQFYIVVVPRDLKDLDVNKSDFAKVKRDFDGRLDGIVGKQQTEAKIEAQPIHESSERHFSFAGQYRGELGQGCAVGSIALVRGHLWTLVVRNEKGSTYEDLVRAKSDAKQWVADTIANNPSDEATLERENRERFLGMNINWIDVTAVVVVGALVGIFSKKKNNRKAYRS